MNERKNEHAQPAYSGLCGVRLDSLTFQPGATTIRLQPTTKYLVV
jgi:hypothetical protein